MEKNGKHNGNGNGNSNGFGASKSISSIVKQYVAVGFRHRRLMRTAFLWSLLAALVAIYFFGLKWESDFEILVKHDRVEPAVTPDTSPRPQLPTDASATTIDITNESEILQSEDLLRQVVQACPMTMWGEPKFYSPYLRKITALLPGYDDQRFPNAVSKLASDLQVSVVSSTGLMQVSYSNGDPVQSNCVTNNLTKFYVAKHLAVNRLPKVFDFFSQQTENYRKKLADAEASLLEFAKTHDAVAATNQTTLAVEKANDFEADQHTAEKNAHATEQRLNELRSMKASLPPRISTQVRTADNAALLSNLKSTLNTLELQRTSLMAKYDPSYRLVQDVDTEIGQTKAAIAQQEKAPLNDNTTDQNPVYTWVDQELAKAQSDLAGYQAQVAADTRIVRAYQQKALSYDQKGITQDDLVREVKAAESNFMLYIAKREQARIQDMLDERRVLNVIIAEPPTYAILSLYSPLLLISLALVFAAMIAGGAALVADYMDPSFRTPDEVRDFLEVPVFASIPENGFEVPVGAVKKNGH
jgi:uncharacterized protein involved in exopolysaccharide biosynthesis